LSSGGIVCTIFKDQTDSIDWGCAINYRNLSVLLLLCIIAAGCRRIDVGPTPIPTLSPTPRSTALPALPTSVPLGSEANPIQMMVVLSDPTAIATELTAFQTAITDATGLSVQIIAVERPAEALAAICASPEGVVSVAWLDGLTALAADAQGCGDLTLTAVRQLNDETTAAQTIQIITRRATESIAALEGRTFCRVSAADLETWLYPSIMLKANSLDVVRDIEGTEEFASAAEVAAAVAGNDCDAAGISTETFAALDEDMQDDLTVLEPTLSVPYRVLVYPQQASLGIRSAIDNALGGFAGNPEQLPLLQVVLMADSVRPVIPDDLESLRDALRAANLDLAQIGR
jgi:ABC-type phosphate/phosphonate transport system substrate-binding protein